jgi:CNT family concentrative nucleoside transporter
VQRFISFAGIFVFLVLAYLISENKKSINYRIVAWGMSLQLVFALFILKTKFGELLFAGVRKGFGLLIGFSDKGAGFVFGNLVNNTAIGAIFAFKLLPVIIFVSSLMGILYYFGVIQFFVVIGARIMRKTMKISGAESLCAALLVFMGIEATTAVKEYIKSMTRSELFVVMSAFMATIASSVMVTYASFGAEPGHLLAASIMSAPAAVVIAKLMVPETQAPQTSGAVEFKTARKEHNVIEAAANGASLGLNLALQVAAMIIAFIGLVWMIDALFGIFGTSFDKAAGYLFSPFAVLMGIPFNEALAVGKLLGTKTVFNEFLAYLELKNLIAQGSLSARSVVISTYALCGFANFGSLAILIGGLGGIVPERKGEVAGLGIKAMISGTFACFITACIAGVLW